MLKGKDTTSSFSFRASLYLQIVSLPIGISSYKLNNLSVSFSLIDLSLVPGSHLREIVFHTLSNLKYSIEKFYKLFTQNISLIVIKEGETPMSQSLWEGRVPAGVGL